MGNKVNSPLRYPGGKSKLTNYVEHLLRINQIDGTYIEPFAGGAGIAINLLLSHKVEQIIINDLDSSVYSFWYTIKNNSKKLIKLINEVPFDSKNRSLTPKQLIEYWDRTKFNYLQNRGQENLKEAFSFFMLNRMNVSGIISGGPIGGRKQDGEYDITVRFNRKDLITRIKNIAEHENKIIIQNLDAISFIQNIVNSSVDLSNSFLFVDPPYFYQGKNLYPSYIEKGEHGFIAEVLQNNSELKWIETYDMSEQISNYYSDGEVNKFLYNLRYSAMNKRISDEMIFSGKNIILDSFEKVILRELDFANKGI